MALIHVMIDGGDAQSGSGHGTVFELDAAGGGEDGGVVDEHALAELHPVAEIADEGGEDAHVVQFPAEQFLQILHVAGVIRHLGVGPGAQDPCPHHLVHCLLEVGLLHVRGPSLLHQFIYISGFVFHDHASSPLSFSQRRTSLPDWAARLPVTDRPRRTSAPGSIFFRSRSLDPMPLPSLVHRGRTVLPEKSK